jgi:hypothetical protein
MTKSSSFLKRYHDIFVAANSKEELKPHIQFESESKGYVPLNFACTLSLASEIESRPILFVGINPSFNYSNESDLEHSNLFNASATDPYADEKDYDFFSFPFGLEKHTGDKIHPYFKEILKLVESSKIDLKSCGYVDLFVHRRTSQKSIDHLLKTESGVDFLVKQLELFHELVFEHIKPKLIVVLNAQAQSFMGLRRSEDTNVWLGYRAELGSIFGTKKLTGVEPKLSEGFKPAFNKNEFTHILPSRILTGMPQEDRNKIAWTLHHFHRLYIAEPNVKNPKEKFTKLFELNQMIEESKIMHLEENDYEYAGKVRQWERRFHEKVNALITEYLNMPI